MVRAAGKVYVLCILMGARQEKEVKARHKTRKGESLVRAAGKVIRGQCKRRKSNQDVRHGKETLC